MPLSLTYTVHSFVETTEAVTMPVNGQEMQVLRPVAVVELTDPTHGHTFRLNPRDRAQADEIRAAFAPGSTVTVTFNAGS